MPGVAQAADPVGPAGAPGKAFTAETFRSPADRTTVTAQAGSAGNPDLALALEATTYSAHRINLQTTVTSADAVLDVVIDWGDGGEPDKLAPSGSAVLNRSHMYAEVGAYTVTVTVKDWTNNVTASNVTKVVTAGTEFTPHTPTRLLDTRAGVGAAKAKVAGKGMVALKVGGNAQIPADVAAVALNVTVTNTTDAGHIAVQPGKDFIRPTTSNLNYVAGQSVPNLVIVPVRDGYVHLVNSGAGSVDLIADVTGYFKREASSGYTSLAPVRFVDTREGLGTAKGQVPGQATFGVQIAGQRGVPAGVTAVALNMTVTNPREAGHLIAFPSGQQAPTTSNVNFTTGQTIANSVIVPVGADGKINIRNGAWAGVDVIVDVVGYYSTDSKAAFVPFGPYRIYDTRDPESWPKGQVPARGYLARWVSGDAKEGVEGYALNVTVTNTTDAGFLSVAPSPFPWLVNDDPNAPKPERPGASALNWTAGQTVPNLVQANDGEHGIMLFWNQGWSPVDLIVDALGVYETN